MRTTLQPGLTNRLTKYLRTTQQLIEEGRDAVSSKELGDFTGINPVQVRRDLNAIGFSGTRGVGYQAYDLVEAVRDILGLRQTYNIALVGAGNLGAPSRRAPSCPRGASSSTTSSTPTPTRSGAPSATSSSST